MTGEHVWGQWHKDYIKPKANKHYMHHALLGKEGTDPRHQVKTRAGGSPLLREVPIACGACNNGWLSGIQNEAKDVLLPLIGGKDRCLLGAQKQRVIATWATMATITAEFIDGRYASVAVSATDRAELMRTRAPLDGWRIWIGRYRRRVWEGSYVHACQPIYFEDDLVVPNVQEPGVPLPSTQWSTFVLGELYVHCASSSTSSDLISTWQWSNAPRARFRLAQVWPPKEQIISWPLPLLSDQDAQNFAVAHFNHLYERTKGRP